MHLAGYGERGEPSVSRVPLEVEAGGVWVNPYPFSKDGNPVSSSSTNGNTLTLTGLKTTYPNDVLYLSWVGNAGQTISVVSAGSTSPSTTSWQMRGSVSASNGGNYVLQTWYAISSIAGTYSIIITTSDSNGNCAAVLFAVSGANTQSPFDLSQPFGGTGGSASGAQLATGITTINANDFVIGALGVQNGFQNGAQTGTIQVNNQPIYGMIGAQVDASYSRCTADAYLTTTKANFYTDPNFAWNSNCKGPWGILIDAIKKGS